MRDQNKPGAVGATQAPAEVAPITSDQPLVIDLPDGQKLVVGNMVAGSVIEVATWRGTGRPDSRTSRLMLGMSPGSITPTVVKADEDQSVKATTGNRFAAFLTALQSFPKNLLIKKVAGATKPVAQPEENRPSASLSLKSNQPKSKRAHFLDFLVRSSHEHATESQTKQEQVEIDQWLDSIRAKSEASSKKASQAKKTTKPAEKSKKATTTSRNAKGK